MLIHKLVDYLLRAPNKDRPCGAGALLIEMTRNLTQVGPRRVFVEIGTVMGIELFERSLQFLR